MRWYHSIPPGQGMSPPVVNVLWGLLNLAIGYVLLSRVGDFQLRRTRDVATAGVGGLLMALMLARHFGQVMGGH